MRIWVSQKSARQSYAMVESLSGAEMAGVLTRLDTAISELRISELTQEQTSVVLSDVFFAMRTSVREHKML